ncbi:unnamed protein product [Cylindrotheca closterium]|uniref:Uncharacterized protein n=1 Tax=Cylindrotheca closterium TaxID=2856 RepID=A0AAD2JKM1_9STRA|nr:unnamed protein product [Cylindrotheca closterium]
MCRSNDLRTSEACKATGRRQRFYCSLDGQSNIASGGEEKNEVYKSCKRTEADGEFSMVRFQVFCFFLGSMALASAKKQLRLSSSLFDQRKRGLQATPRRQTDEKEDEVEMSQFEEETRRLVWNTSNPLEVI